MKIINYICLIVCVSLAGACFKKAPSSNLQTTTQPIAPSAPNAPIVEKTAAPTDQTNAPAGGDYDAAMNHLNSKNYGKAAAEFEAVVKKDQKNRLAQLGLARSYKNLNKSDETVAAYKKAIDLKPEEADANFELGKFLMDKKDHDAAQPYLQKAAKISYTSPEYLVAVGDNLRALDRCNDAVPPYGNALNFDGRNTAALYGMGLCYIELKNRIAAHQQVRNLEKLDPALAKKLENQIPK